MTVLVKFSIALLTTSLAACSRSADPTALSTAGSTWVSFDDLYAKVQQLTPAVRTAGMATYKSMSFGELYTNLLARATNQTATIGDVSFYNLRDQLAAKSTFVEQLDQSYSTIGSYWTAIHYTPAATITEAKLVADLHDLAGSSQLGLAGGTGCSLIKGICQCFGKMVGTGKTQQPGNDAGDIEIWGPYNPLQSDTASTCEGQEPISLDDLEIKDEEENELGGTGWLLNETPLSTPAFQARPAAS